MSVMLEVRGLEVNYGHIEAVRGIDLDPVSYTHLTLPTICSV